MGITDIADSLTRQVENLSAGLSEALFEPVIRLGVTGLARSGKTVFITGLVANLLDRARMPALRAEAEGRIQSVMLRPQPDDTVPRFDYEAHLGAMTGSAPRWPESTRAVSELRLSFRVTSGGILGGFRGPRTVHLDIVDYPGEWLLDLSLIEKTYDQWSAEVLRRTLTRAEAAGFREALSGVDPAASHDEPLAQALAASFTGYLKAARAAGYSDCTPGRFLLPGELEGSPVLTFAPLPEAVSGRSSLRREMARRYEAYKSKVVKPFFREHFAKVDRQVVLVDVLGAIHAGPRAVEDLRQAMADILRAFRPGKASWLGRVLGTKRVERILFAATKADHIHHEQHTRLTAIMAALMREAKDRAEFAGADVAAMSVAGMRATVEETLRHDGAALPAVRGTQANGKAAAFYPGELPADPALILNPAREGEARWLDGDYGAMAMQPARVVLKPGEGPPHIRLDRAAEFLIGDRL